MKSFIGAVIFICVALSANAQLLWKVSGNGLSSPSYIMGTHHLAPLSVKDGITGLQKAMDETQQVYGELKMSDIQSPATIQKMQKMMMIESDTTLTTLLSPEDYETANKFCKENLMMDLNMAPKIKPAFLLNNIAVVAYIKHIGNYNPQEQLDTYFQTQATQKGKKVPGETSHGLLPTYLVWNEDQGDVVPLKGTELLARNQGKTHYQGAGLEPSVVMHRYPKFSFLSYLHKQTTPIQERSKHTSIQNISIHQMRTSISNRYPHSTHYNQTSGLTQ